MATTDLGFLDEENPIYTEHRPGWIEDELRLYGGRAVFRELTQWAGEDDVHYENRKSRASYLNFPAIHTGMIAGHLRTRAPVPGRDMSFGSLGVVRQRGSIDQPTVAELIWYAANGVGAGAQQYEAWVDGFQGRAMATGLRWCMIEMPSDIPPGVRVGADGKLSGGSTRWRPFPVEYSPAQVSNWDDSTPGLYDFAVIRVPIGVTGINDKGEFERPSADDLGYYLLVRQDYEGLGPAFKEGGWWKFTSEKEPFGDKDQQHGRWENTEGEIPLFSMQIGNTFSPTGYPVAGRSMSTELGNIAVSLMDLISARDYDAIDAARSVKYILGGDAASHNLVARMHEAGSLVITIPPYYPKDKDGKLIPGAPPMNPSLYDSSAGAVAARVFSDIINGKIAEAKEAMLRQVLAGLDQSGRSRETSFGATNAPLLSSIAAVREGFDNNFLYFCCLRAGVDPNGAFADWPRTFPLAPMSDEIDQMAETLRTLEIKAPTLRREMVMASATERRLLKDDATARAVRGELGEELGAQDPDGESATPEPDGTSTEASAPNTEE